MCYVVVKVSDEV